MRPDRNSIFLVAGLLIILSITFFTVTAATKTWQGYVGGVTVIAEKNVLIGGGYYWFTDLMSGASANINIIGYTYWTIGEYCPSNNKWAYWIQYPGDYDTNDDWYYTMANVAYRGCPGTSRYWSLGNHDFAYGSEHKYPYVSVYESR